MRQALASLACLVVIASITARPARADDYPTKPIRLLLPQPAGGAVDLIARSATG